MKIHVGSQNPAKVEAVKDIIKDYELLQNAEVIGLSTDSGVEEQPLSLDETIKGAMNRSQRCFKGSQYSIGIEGGLINIKYQVMLGSVLPPHMGALPPPENQRVKKYRWAKLNWYCQGIRASSQKAVHQQVSPLLASSTFHSGFISGPTMEPE